MEWFYVAEQRQVGPLSEAEFARLVGLGTIRGETLVWRAGMKDWQPYSALLPPGAGSAAAGAAPAATGGNGGQAGGFATAGVGGAAAAGAGGAGAAAAGAAGAAPGAPITANCTQCGRAFDAATMLPWQGGYVCAGCKPAFVQRLKEGAPLAAGVRYGGFWIRFVARFIDGLILGVVNIVITMPLGIGAMGTLGSNPDGGVANLASFLALQGLVILIRLTVSATYEILLTWKTGATLGKMALRLKVVRPDGGGLTLGRAIGRYFSTWISSIILCIGYIIAAFDDEKRSLHDRICDTRVVRV
jgi:uncharacterized RDD family membrane protein YckC